jgi:hypothetical protein
MDVHMKFPNITVKVIPISEQRFTTLGDWLENPDGSFVITLPEMNDWRVTFLVLMHELVEWGITQSEGTTTSACDDFDAMWEQEIKDGKQLIETEAGFDPRCPYRRGHVWGYRAERVLCWILGLSWKSYGAECDRYLDQI